MPSESISTTASKSPRLKVAIGIRAAHQRKQIVFVPIARHAQAATICCARISSGACRDFQPVQFARANRAHQRRAFDQFIARGGEQAGLSAARPPNGRRGRRAAARPRSIAASRSGTPDRPSRYRFPVRAKRSPPPRASSPFFRRRSASRRSCARKAAMMRQHRVRTQPLAQMHVRRVRKAARVFTKTSVVRLCANQLGDAIVNLAPHFVAGHGAQFVARHLDRQFHLAPMAD